MGVFHVPGLNITKIHSTHFPFAGNQQLVIFGYEEGWNSDPVLYHEGNRDFAVRKHLPQSSL